MADASMPEVLTVETGAIAAGGGCVARAPDGRVMFVRHALPGETVIAAITSATTSFLRADATEVLTPSPDRVTPPCPHAGPGRCGGCDFQHISMTRQRQLKADLIVEQLRRVAGMERDVTVEPVDGDHDGLQWRSRIRLAIDDQGFVAFRRHRSHQLETVESCPISTPAVMATRVFESKWLGVDQLEVVAAADGTAIISAGTRRTVKPTFPEVAAGLVVNGRVQRRPGSVLADVSGHSFRVSAGVFWQVHPGAAATLAKAVISGLEVRPGDNVVDLYAGAGLFSVVLADQVGPTGTVLAVERDRKACDDATHNGRAFPHLKVLRASVSPKSVGQFIGSPDLLVLDPAREGAGTAVMAAIEAHAPTLRRIAYISCDPASFSRDIRVLLNANWRITSLRAFDIFPMTEHVEMVAIVEPPPS
jgi:tRNA/tmRNA/rRNA uracil-C5-methylase (TrmA/RlmC/RlmD family)